MRMRLPNGDLATTDAENASVFGPYFHRVFNNRRLIIGWHVLDKIKQREVMDKLDHTISWDEIKKATNKLANDKAPGLNGVPPNNAFKALDDANLSWLLLFYNQFWHSQADFGEWHEGQVVSVPKKGDTSDKWSWMPRWHINDQDTSTSKKTQPQPSNMGGILRPRQGL